jgi:glycoside/pentoside/hexuronide:cation symporter, GPH family
MENAASPIPVVEARDRLPFITKFIFGLGDWGATTTSTIFGFFFSFFLTDVARLDPLFAAPVLLIGGIWDAINDPLIGVLADRIHTRWGRRRPLIFASAIPLSLSFIMLWWVPPWDSNLARAAYYALAYILFDTFFTLVTVPYTSLTPELTEDYDERTRLNGYRMSVSMAGGLIAAVSVPFFTSLFPERKTGYLVMAAVFGSLACIPYFLIFAVIKERFSNVTQSQLNIFTGFLYTWRNRAFRYAAGIYLTAWVTVSLASALFQYYVTYVMKMPERLDIILGLLQLGALICIPVMVWMANRLGKQKAYLIGVSWWVIVMIILAFLPSHAQIIVFVLALSVGLGVAAAHVVPWSIIPDVIDADEITTHQRREGTYYGFMVFLQKCGVAFVLAFTQWMLHLSGYVPNGDQPASALLTIRLLMGPLPAVLLGISMFLVWRYPISKAQHAANRATLAARRLNPGPD